MFPSIRLSSGAEFPQLGLGMWKIAPEQCATLVQQAVAAGYRHFDCACDYGNEQQVGDGLQQVIQNGCPREQLWVTSKLWNTFHHPDHVRLACEKSLADLKLDYLDLYLIHFPIAQQFVPIETRYPPGWFTDPNAAQPHMVEARVPIADTWGAMQELKQAGLVKEIGVSNFGISLLRDLLNTTDDSPAVLQVESHPYLVQQKLWQFCQQNNIAYTAFSPLGALSYHELGMAEAGDTLLELDTVQQIAQAHSRTPAQILLRWAIQRPTVVIPKTSRAERLVENAQIFDFSLTDAEMDAISGLDQHRRYNDPGVFCEAAFNTFFPIYE